MTRISTLLIIAVALLAPALARAHCDTLDGPVVGAARTALQTGELAPVLAWVKPSDEAVIRDAFAKARAARKAGKEARDVADTWFFETVVRVHRAGEGAPYTGLKPAGEALDPAVAAVDRAVAKGDAAEVERMLVDDVRSGLRERFARVAAEKPPGADVAAGRRWVAAYVPLVHWAEAVDAAARAGGEHAGHAGAASSEEHAGHATGGHASREEPAAAAPHPHAEGAAASRAR